MGLQEYRKKRHFAETPEPKGRKSSSKRALLFVVQKHDASHLHYDFRLEVDGVLKSWAIPKGPSLNPKDKRLAVQVEDHPFDYRTFEGTIPEGNYGAGTVMVWDEGTYTVMQANTHQESENLMKEGLDEGRLTFVLNGTKLKGEFSLVRLKGDRNKQWLLIKKKDEFATDQDVTEQDQSVLTQKTMEEIAGQPSPKKKVRKLIPPKANQKEIFKTEMPHGIKPMLATLVEAPFDRANWIFEMKWDGYRALAEVQKGKVNLYSRNFQSFNKRFPPVVKDLKNLKEEALLDGEIVLLDEEGKPSFQLIQNYQRDKREPLIYYVFDILYLNGDDLRHLPLIQRKEILRKILPEESHIRYCDHIEEYGIEFFQGALKYGYEGIIAKDEQSPYREGRSKDWLKIKTHYRQEVVICGFTEPKGSRQNFGSLILGVYDQKKLIYIGHTGSGFDRKKLAEIHARLLPLVQAKSPFEDPPKTNASVTWVQPKLVCEVTFAEWTRDGQMRQPIFVDFREDKKPKEVIRERTISVNQVLKPEA